MKKKIPIFPDGEGVEIKIDKEGVKAERQFSKKIRELYDLPIFNSFSLWDKQFIEMYMRSPYDRRIRLFLAFPDIVNKCLDFVNKEKCQKKK